MTRFQLALSDCLLPLFLAIFSFAATGQTPDSAGERPEIRVLHAAIVPYPPMTGQPLTLIVSFAIEDARSSSVFPMVFTVSVEQAGRVLAKSRPLHFDAPLTEVSEARKQFTAAGPGDYQLRARLESRGTVVEKLVPLRIPASSAESAATSRRMDCSHLPGSATALDPVTGEPGCVCDPGKVVNATGTECVSCAAADGAIRSAMARKDFAVAERILAEVPACSWAALARSTLEIRRQIHEENPRRPEGPSDAEARGGCFVAATWGEPPRYAVECDSGDGPGALKLANGGYFVLVKGPTTWDQCADFMRSNRVAGW